MALAEWADYELSGMTRTLKLRAGICLRHALWCAIVLFCSVLSGRATQQEDTNSIPAEQIIQILQQNPDVLADAKAQIVTALRDRGYAVTQADITDDRLFSQIRSDDRVRAVVSDELKRRGFGTEAEEPEPPATQKPAPESKGAPQQTPAAKTGAADDNKKTAPSQSNYPYRNLPVLKDLYTQSIADPAKLERFGAALFRNSTVSDKTALDIPVTSDYLLGPGDQLIIEYWGSSSQKLQSVVDREGRVVLPEAGAILVAGHTLAETHELIQKALARQFRDISVSVSLGRLKTVRAYVVGDVKNPGAYDISALSTALSALLAA